MNYLNNIEELMELMKWQQAEGRMVEITFSNHVEPIFTLTDEHNEKQTVHSFEEVTLSKQDIPKKKRDFNKFFSKVNGSIYPFTEWMKQGNRSVTFVLEDDLWVDVFDFELKIGQRVRSVERIDLESEKILSLMTLCIPLKEDDPKRSEYLREIAALEIKKANK